MSKTTHDGAKLKKLLRKRAALRSAVKVQVSLKKGDSVVVISGGNEKRRVLKGKIGKIVKFVGENKDRVLLDGVNVVTRHTKATAPNRPQGKVPKEAPIHVSNLMYYVEKYKKGVRIKHRVLEDGRKVRGYLNPESKEFVQIEG
jgi:large subunit ribosomal protein L24